LRSEGQRSRSLGTKTKTSFFANISVKSGSIYVKPRSQYSAAHSTYIVEYISPAKMLRFRDICLYLSRTAATWPCTYLLITCWPTTCSICSRKDVLGTRQVRFIGRKGSMVTHW